MWVKLCKSCFSSVVKWDSSEYQWFLKISIIIGAWQGMGIIWNGEVTMFGNLKNLSIFCLSHVCSSVNVAICQNKALSRNTYIFANQNIKTLFFSLKNAINLSPVRKQV